jgi:hypothetical protein
MTFKFSINELSKEIERGKGLSKASHYFVFIQPPKAMQGNFLSSFSDAASVTKAGQEIVGLSAKCESASLPGKKLATTNFIMYGTYQQMPYGINYNPWSAQFICTNSMEERNFFDNWMKSITDPFSNNFEYYQNYVSNIWILKLPQGLPNFTKTDLTEIALSAISSNGGVAEEIAEKFGIYIMKLEEAYPIEITSQELSRSSDSYLTLNVDFVYRKFHSLAEYALF